MDNKYVLFYRGPFSNFYKAPFKAVCDYDNHGEELLFQTNEQWMMYNKARLFKDEKCANVILKLESPVACKLWGRKVKGFDQNEWDKACEDIVTKGLICKFQQNPDLKTLLLSTGTKTLAEANPNSYIWGIGISIANARTVDPNLWKGQNKLGKCLMRARDFLLSN